MNASRPIRQFPPMPEHVRQRLLRELAEMRMLKQRGLSQDVIEFLFDVRARKPALFKTWME